MSQNFTGGHGQDSHLFQPKQPYFILLSVLSPMYHTKAIYDHEQGIIFFGYETGNFENRHRANTDKSCTHR